MGWFSPSEKKEKEYTYKDIVPLALKNKEELFKEKQLEKKLNDEVSSLVGATLAQFKDIGFEVDFFKYTIGKNKEIIFRFNFINGVIYCYKGTSFVFDVIYRQEFIQKFAKLMAEFI